VLTTTLQMLNIQKTGIDAKHLLLSVMSRKIKFMCSGARTVVR